MIHPESFIKDQIPVSKWSTIPTILKSAYAAANEIYQDNPIFQAESARYNKGRVISWAVDFGFERAIKNGALDCDCKWTPFSKPTGRFLELRFQHSTASISLVSTPSRQPRPVGFRENARLRTQSVFAFPELEKELEISGLPHFHVVHGYQELTFAHIAMPAPDSNVRYSWLSNNLLKLPHEVKIDRDVPPENTDYDLDELNLLKEDIERWMKDNGSD
ncbi:hypothetical protein [Brucella lupini]